MLARVLARIPPAAREVEAADECDFVVHGDDLLVVRSAEGMAIVQTERHARAVPKTQGRPPLAFERVQHRVVPGEDVAVQALAATHDCVEKRSQLMG
jgi:hypothetical protein